MSFKLKTILGIALIEVVVLGILVMTSLQDLRSSNEQELRTRAQTSAKLLATMTSDAVVALDLATLDALVEQALANEGLLYVQIRNSSGLVLAEGGEVPARTLKHGNGLDDHDLSDNYFDVAAPILAGGANFGEVQIGLSASLLNDVVAAGTRRMLTIAGFEVLLVAVFGYMLGSVLTRQLTQLRDSAARVAKGEFGYHMPVRGNDELASTAHSFNTMSTALAEFARTAKNQRDEAEAGRKIAETLLHNAINSVSQAIFIVAENGELRFVNRAALDLYGLKNEDCLSGARFEDVLLTAYAAGTAKDADAQTAVVQDRLQRLDSESIQTWQSEWMGERILLHTQRPIVTGGFVMVDTDITALCEVNEKNRRLELELMETHKLESLGTLASGVAHEINTPTQFIGDNLKFLREAFTDLTEFVDKVEKNAGEEDLEQLRGMDWDFLKDEIPSALLEAAEGVESIGKIVRSIKEFAHPDDTESTEADMIKLIENAVTVSRSQWRHSAELTFEPAEPDMMVPCYPGDMSQVVINLVVNAADAISEYSQSRDYSGGKGEITVSLEKDEQYCTIKVADNGPGIPMNSVRRIFDMFYTTKPPGKGTGQGLAICKSLVEIKHKGKLSVHSEIGKGSTFVVKLPLNPVHSKHTDPAQSRAA
ncbi:sensor histidine kinase [Roseibium aggregatum]|uniref:histidine kinase n=1 Tax=Roseibium aggregatum TaxID=187304 RepID=A0A939EI07_9HYPH|nr:ATP-binding protein [Roseibium aggregatum]MBN9672100.1 PAS-domain containing protein [Roseibium aggregatum]